MRSPSPSSDSPLQDTVVFDPGVFEKIAGRVAKETPGILDLGGNVLARLAGPVAEDLPIDKGGIVADIEGDKVSLHMKIVLAYGAKAPDVFAQVRKAIAKDMTRMTGFELAQLTLRVVDIMTPQAYEASKSGPLAPPSYAKESP